MKRRTFIIGALACSCRAHALSAAGHKRQIGCYVRGEAANGTPVDYDYKLSSGVPLYDSTVKRALDRIAHVLGRPLGANLRFMDEYNAHVNPDPNPKVIAFGKALLDDLAGGGDFELKVTCVAAHETAHILQFEDPYFDFALTDATVRRSELEADAFAGACLAFLVNGRRKIDRGVLEKKRPGVQSAFGLMFKLGDNLFSNPNHHGTSEERLDAVDSGYTFSNEIAGGGPLTGDISTDIMDKARTIGVR